MSAFDDNEFYFENWNDIALDIDVAESRLVEEIEKANMVLEDENLAKLIKAYYKSEDGLECIRIVEGILKYYHDLLDE